MKDKIIKLSIFFFLFLVTVFTPIPQLFDKYIFDIDRYSGDFFSHGSGISFCFISLFWLLTTIYIVKFVRNYPSKKVYVVCLIMEIFMLYWFGTIFLMTPVYIYCLAIGGC